MNFTAAQLLQFPPDLIDIPDLPAFLTAGINIPAYIAAVKAADKLLALLPDLVDLPDIPTALIDDRDLPAYAASYAAYARAFAIADIDVSPGVSRTDFVTALLEGYPAASVFTRTTFASSPADFVRGVSLQPWALASSRSRSQEALVRWRAGCPA